MQEWDKDWLANLVPCTFLLPLCLITGAEGTLPGFPDYMYKHIVPACFLAPLKMTFDLNDGHSFLVCFVSVMFST